MSIHSLFFSQWPGGLGKAGRAALALGAAAILLLGLVQVPGTPAAGAEAAPAPPVSAAGQP
jgi:hypothetical protein